MYYKQLSEYERAYIAAYLRIKKSIRGIAGQLNRSPSTISREISRNSLEEYDPIEAGEIHIQRKAKLIVLDKYQPFLNFLYDNFDKRINSIDVLRATALKNKMFQHIPSTKSIYLGIKQSRLKLKSYQLLRASNKYKRNRSAQKNKKGKEHRVLISWRPKIINQRNEIGHGEGDSVTMSNNGNRVLTIVERVSRYAITIKTHTQEMGTTHQLIKEAIIKSHLPFKSITFDNGSEFNECYKLEGELGIKVYYCHAYSPSERGTNEVGNGILRRFFPKGTDGRKVSADEINSVTNGINKTPRRLLGYKCPLEVISI